MEQYVLKETIPDKNWDSFVDNSPNGTIFSTPKGSVATLKTP